MSRLVLISGCSGGGKSTLLTELGGRGHAIIEEPGWRIVKQELEGDGIALPWNDMMAFARRAIEMAIADHTAAQGKAGWTFFDRGLIDAAAALQHLTGEPILEGLSAAHRYNRSVFLTPPWPDIYVTDPHRRHGFDEAVAEYDRLAAIYPVLGYNVVILPKLSVADRADFILDRLETP
ncbi:putative ATPase [Rhizobium leguminosarum bv. trifolii WSM2297]|uniref:Putative ATPase n=1 Tax=Rhizobium leguminosarum bv. trifolii WSM2297 TaxID=754762 RepID=J0W1R5_RHILT|nr:AAA family ATPase [Rhizobium leguminosarum]EJC79656.1 putative ATPase [Rhizobium leguminosarum bv. trifolii WSM2297]